MSREPTRIDRWLGSLLREPLLWPILIVVGAHAVLLVASILLFVVRTPSGFSVAALALLVVGSGELLRRDLARRRLGTTSRTVVLLWVLSGLAAWAADRSALF